jgi:putative ABC transport system permease protein
MLAAQKLRSTLTLFGIVVGVAGVLLIDAIGQAQNAAIAAQFAQLGSNLVSVSSAATTVAGVSAGTTGRPSLLASDADAIRREVPHIAAVTPDVSGRETVIYQNRNASTQVEAAYPDVQVISSYGVVHGTFFTPSDEATAAPVGVVGQTVVEHLFDGQDPVGQAIRVRNVTLRVVGVLAPKGNNGQHDLDDVVVIPFSTGQKLLFGHGPVPSILVQADQAGNLDGVVAGITRALELAHRIAPGGPDDFRVLNYQAIVDQAKAQARVLTTILTGIAGVALAVGAFGIMSIMLMAVSQRTPEIGVRVAVGARPRDVLGQFLIEAVTITLVGGVLGVLLGFAGALLLPSVVPSLAAHAAPPTPGAAAVALGIAALSGGVFGFLPARRAANLDPVEALRWE